MPSKFYKKNSTLGILLRLQIGYQFDLTSPLLAAFNEILFKNDSIVHYVLTTSYFRILLMSVYTVSGLLIVNN